MKLKMEPLSQYVIFIAGTQIHKKKICFVFLDPMLKALPCMCMSSGYCCTPIDMKPVIFMSIFRILDLVEMLKNKIKTIPWKITSALRNQYCNNIKNNNDDVCF